MCARVTAAKNRMYCQCQHLLKIQIQDNGNRVNKNNSLFYAMKILLQKLIISMKYFKTPGSGWDLSPLHVTLTQLSLVC